MRKHIKILVICAGMLGISWSTYGEEVQPQCTGIVTNEPANMYDFKLGNWDIAWRNKTGVDSFFEFKAVSKVYEIMGGDISIDEQTADIFKGITFRTYDPKKEEWVVRWLPANSTFAPLISAKLENCIPVERHKQMAASGKLASVRTSFTHITKNKFEFHQDWSLDDGKTWEKDVLFYEATRKQVNPEDLQEK